VTGDELRRLRRTLGLTQAALAARVGVTPNSLARQERGELGIAEPVARLLRHLATQDAAESPGRRGPTMGPSARDFESALNALFADAWRRGLEQLDVEAGALHRQVGGYPGVAHRMPLCCAVMRQAMRQGDRILQQPPKGDGATVRIRYFPDARRSQ
jgi:5-methylcytosine-specific restriction protein A